MKRKLTLLVGNLLMIVGMLLMVGSMAFTVGVLIFVLPVPDIYSEASLMGIFIGALIWLGGAGMGGRRECIADKYYWLRNFHSRYRRRMP
ncbi:stress-induced protein YchH [Morganella psychrotolerans]|uniref:DUF2583 domain-containing protein n=1 Tax=Morganella psychrotolerans TaxID=368603 RepID=A0A1B8HPT3_9GAMM|nr:stress-induced protein YchH [Morganella psychrotolerans]OBU11348.1 hypothetical protein AYY17_00950 [Morganella psychrotolerans]